jgi:hypothetical protein
MARVSTARRRAAWAGAVLATGLLLLSAGATRAAEQLDWCAPLVVRPDQRFWAGPPTCEPWWPDDEIARRADLVLDGFLPPWDTGVALEPASCFGTKSMASSAAYHARMRAAAAGYGRSLVFVYQARFDLVDRHTAGSPGFDPDSLVDATRSWRSSTDFFARDRSASCACGCEWSDDAGPQGQPAGQRLRDLLDAAGGAGTYESSVVYSMQPSEGGSAQGAPRRFFGSAAVGDLRDPAYRAWRIGHMQDAIEHGGFDVVALNHKFHQYLPTEPPPYWDSDEIPDVDAYRGVDDTVWSSPAQAYGYPEYVQGWTALAADLEAAGVPFSVSLYPGVWRPDTVYDDPATPDVDEAALIRAVAHRARFVLLQRAPQFSQAELDAIEADVESEGIATAVFFDSNCGYGNPPGRTPAPLTASLTLAPDNAVVDRWAATSLRVRPGGTATGPWDADLWCHCPTLPCGAPDASVAGVTAASWDPPLGLCDAAVGATVGNRRTRIEVRRAGHVATGSRTTVVCAPTCANARDDDRDGLADFPADPGCASADDVDETEPTLKCDDNASNDADGLIDHPEDPQCTSPTAPREGTGSGCGLGAELSLGLALGAAARRRRAA